MLFHSQIFVLGFLPIVLVGYYALARKPETRQWLLVAASLIFYAWWDARFLPLIMAQTLVSWAAAVWHFRTGAKWPLRLAIAANLSVLGLYKYLDFFVSVVEDASGLALPKSNLILPIGISFYTFQIVSYLVDALRHTAPSYSLRNFMLFVVLFPQLIAGPIVRHNEIIDQFKADPLREGWSERMSRGLALFVIAAAAKVLLADKLAASVDPHFAAAASGSVPTLADAAFASLGFALQIFFDFAAYSEMAIGLALMLGLSLPRNFDQPYRALSLQDFWRRWHMTLSRFLRDYLYIPLGGSRQGTSRYLIATMVTMGLCGLWHGAGWTFIVWGVLHGMGLVICRGWTKLKLRMPDVMGWLITVIFVVLLFVVFRATDLASAGRILAGLTGSAGLGAAWQGKDLILILIAAALALAPFTMQQAVERWLAADRRMAAALGLLCAFIVLEVGKGQPQSFIYFQF